MRRSPGHRALRQGRVSLPNHVYLLTTTAAFRRPVFKDTENARAIARTITEPACWGDATLLCWVLMPDHWHGLVQLGARDSLSLVVNRFKAFTAKRLHCTQAGLVWDRGFQDRALRKDDDLKAAARYIVANPVRAGLVSHVLDYPYWDCIWL